VKCRVCDEWQIFERYLERISAFRLIGDRQRPDMRGFSILALRTLTVLLLAGCLPFFAHAGSPQQHSADSAFESAVKAFNEGKLEEAERLADAAEKANPKKPDIPNLRGAIFAKQKRYSEAAEQFNSALARDPNFYQAKLNLAEVNLQQGKYAESGQLYEELQKIDPASELLQFKLILCALLLGDANKASTMADVMKFPGKTPAYYYARAAIALKRGSKESAQKYFENVRKYYSDEQCAYFSRSLKDLALVSTKPAAPAQTEGPPAKNPDSPTKPPE
jgi:tetratricopeptide (TPR) repeat protein